eukprot:IDg6646t1
MPGDLDSDEFEVDSLFCRDHRPLIGHDNPTSDKGAVPFKDF